jgi:hypothetical protein
VNLYGSEDSAVLPEDHNVWKYLEKSDLASSSTCKYIKSEDEIKFLRDWLFSKLPNSSKVFGLLHNCVNDIKFWVDNYRSPSIILALSESVEDNQSHCEISGFGMEFDDISIKYTCSFIESLPYKYLEFSGFNRQLADSLSLGFRRFKEAWRSACGLFSLMSAYPKIIEAPKGFHFNRLRC